MVRERICDFYNRPGFRGCQIRPLEEWEAALFETHMCEDCGVSFLGDPRMDEEQPVADTEQDWPTEPADRYEGDPNWQQSCLFVPLALVRTKLIDGEWDTEPAKELERIRRQTEWIMKQGNTEAARERTRGIGAGEFSEELRARGKAKGCLGIGGGGDFLRWEWFCPPFTRESLLKAAELLFLGDGLPPRRYWLRSSIDVHPLPYQRSDRIHTYTRIAFELFLYLEIKLERPWFLQEWITQTLLQRHIHRILAQGGPLSREFGRMLDTQQETLSWDRLPDKVPGFLDNLDQLAGIRFDDEKRARVDRRAQEILRFLLDTYNDDVSWAQLFLERCCRICFTEEGERKPRAFWDINRSNRCNPGGYLQLTGMLIGLAVAQALHEKYPERPLDSEAVLRLVKAEMTFTGGDPQKRWNGMMARREEGSCWV